VKTEEPPPPKRWTAVAPPKAAPKKQVKVVEQKPKEVSKPIPVKVEQINEPEPLVCAEGHELVDNAELVKEMLAQDSHNSLGKMMQSCV
jgi:hypothetical protein